METAAGGPYGHLLDESARGGRHLDPDRTTFISTHSPGEVYAVKGGQGQSLKEPCPDSSRRPDGSALTVSEADVSLRDKPSP